MKTIEHKTTTTSLTVPLVSEAHRYAKEFEAEQATPDTGKRVYFNTLAICAVRSFLKWMEIRTELEQGESWNPVIRCFHDVADLVLPDFGTLECRPILPGEIVMNLPLEVTEDRIGYVAVQFQEELDEVQLLGFIPALDTVKESQQISLTSLQPLESLLDCLEQLEFAKASRQNNTSKEAIKFVKSFIQLLKKRSELFPELVRHQIAAIITPLSDDIEELQIEIQSWCRSYSLIDDAFYKLYSSQASGAKGGVRGSGDTSVELQPEDRENLKTELLNTLEGISQTEHPINQAPDS